MIIKIKIENYKTFLNKIKTSFYNIIKTFI